VASAIDVVVQLMRLADGRRVLTEVSEVGRLSTEHQYVVNKIFEFRDEIGPDGKPAGKVHWTGKTSMFTNDVREKGLMHHVKQTQQIFV
jgi:hypothetical protein